MEITYERELEINPVTILIPRNYTVEDVLAGCWNESKFHVEKLIPVYGQKSFYGKAKVRSCGDVMALQSYDTIVAVKIRDKFYRTWDGWSVTTNNHLNSFFIQNDGWRVSKAEWVTTPLKRAFRFNEAGDVILA